MSEPPSLVKVGFRDPDGGIETLWAQDLGNGTYRLQNSSWYAYGISYLDIVEAQPEPDGFLFYTQTIAKSGHRTIRIRSEQNIPEDKLAIITATGATYEGANRKFLAIDIPPSVNLGDVVAAITHTGVEWEYADPTYAQVNSVDL
jgi:Domain of unknown function (DUF4265)